MGEGWREGREGGREGGRERGREGGIKRLQTATFNSELLPLTSTILEIRKLPLNRSVRVDHLPFTNSQSISRDRVVERETENRGDQRSWDRTLSCMEDCIIVGMVRSTVACCKIITISDRTVISVE